MEDELILNFLLFIGSGEDMCLVLFRLVLRVYLRDNL